VYAYTEHFKGLEPATMRMILGDNDPRSRWAIKVQIKDLPDVDLIGEALDARELLVMTEKLHVDLVLIDQELPGLPIQHVIRRLRELAPPPGIVVIGSEPQASQAVLKAGAGIYVCKSDQPNWLADLLREYARQVEKSRTNP
jgi:DNA-binding NarL/FixJ family response regulator